jgi:hypothetical protein
LWVQLSLFYLKKQTSPKLSKTLIQAKDGAIFSKKWLFFRDFLPLEIDITSHFGWLENKKSTGVQKITIKK